MMKFSLNQISFFIALLLYSIPLVFYFKNDEKKIITQTRNPTHLSLHHFIVPSHSKTDVKHTQDIQQTKSTPKKQHTRTRHSLHNDERKNLQKSNSDSHTNSTKELRSGEIDEYAKRIYTIIGQYYNYPPSLARRGIAGEARVDFALDKDGNLLWAKVVSSSGNSALDTLSLSALKQAAKMFPKPPAPTLKERLMSIAFEYGKKK